MTYHKPKQRSHFGQRLLLILITLAILLLLGLAGCAYWGYSITNSDTSFPNMSLDGIPVGGLTRGELAQRLTEQHWPGLDGSTLTVVFPLNLTCTLDRNQAGATRSAAETADEICRFGHDGDWFTNLGTYLQVWLKPGAFELTLPAPELNQTYLLANIRSVIDRFAALTADRDTTLDREHACLSLVKGGGSISLDQDAILTAVSDALLEGENQMIWSEISGDIRMPDFNQVYRDVNVEPQDAHFDEAWNVVPEVVGCSFEVSAAEKLWREARPGTRIEIPLELFEPEVKAADLEGLLYRDRLCFMTTNYWDSDSDRIGNIHLAADCLNGIVILPGEVFSYNNAVGERTEDRGYRWAGAYADGEVTTEIGGGICQVSSTLYCAAMYAQMTTTMRQNHWFPVSYLSMGYDATVSWGGPDYRFKNTRDYPVKLNVYYDDHSVTIEFWGTNVDGSHVSPWTTSNEVYDEEWGCLIGYSVTVIRNILDANDNLITQIQEPTGIYHLHDHEIEWPEAKLRRDAAAVP